MSGYTSAEATAIVIQLIIVLVIVRRSYAMAQGVTYSLARLILLPVLIVVLWAGSELESVALTPWAVPYLILGDTALLVATAAAFTGVAERRTHVGRDDTGRPTFQIGFGLAAIYLVSFLVRLGLAATLFPASLEFGAPPTGFPPANEQIVLAVIDAVYSVSAGLLIGRAIGIHRKVATAAPTPIAR